MFLSHLSFFSFIVYLFLGTYAFWLDRKAKLNRIFMLVCMTFGLWALTYSFIYAAPDRNTCFFWHRISAFSWCILPALAMHTILVLIRKEYRLQRPWGCLLFYFPSLIFLVKAQGGVVFTRDFRLTELGWVDLPAKGTPWYAAYIMYVLVYATIGTVLLTHHYMYGVKSLREKKQLELINRMAIFTTVTSVSVNIALPLLGIYAIPHIAPILLLSIAFAIWYAIVKYKLMVLTPAIAASEIIDGVQDMLVLVSQNYEITKINQRVTEILGYDDGHLIGRKFSILISKQLCEDMFTKSTSDKLSLLASCEIEVRAKDGKVIPIRLFVSAIRDNVIGDITGYVVIGQDMRLTQRLQTEIAQRKLAEEKLKNQADYLSKTNEKLRLEIAERARIEEVLRENEKKFRELFVNAKDVIFLFRIGEGIQTGSIIEANDIACQTLGYTREDLLGLTVSDITIEGHIIDNNNEKETFVKNGSITVDKTFIAKNKAEIPFEVNLQYFRLKGENVILAIARDLTERKKLMGEMVKVEKLQSIGILAGGIAHDFNNILTAILGNISIARRALENDDNVKVRRLLERVEKASKQAKELTQQLLIFSKGGDPIKKVTSIVDLLKESAHFMLRGSNVSCEFLIPDHIWSVEIDPGQISQVVNNIIINAAQAMPTGGVISISCDNYECNDNSLDCKGYVIIRIKDSGIGISQENLKNIFDPYFTTKEKGSGLGLAISYSIIKKHGGSIKVNSELGVGTTFEILLPACSEKGPINNEIVHQCIKGKGRIMVMDDDNMIRELLSMMLMDLGYQVEVAKDGKDAIKT